MVVVTSCVDGPSVVFESSCVFPHNDKKLKFFSLSVERVMTGTDMRRPFQANQKEEKPFTDKNAICSCVCVCVHVSQFPMPVGRLIKHTKRLGLIT